MISARMFLIPLCVFWIQPSFGAPLSDPPSQPLEISESEFRFIDINVSEIQEKFPTEKYLYVVLGTTLASFSAYFGATGMDALDIPASGLRKALNIEFRTPEDKKLLREHFLRFLPTKEHLGDRKILLLDHALTGLSLTRAANYLRGLFGDAYPVETLGFVYEDYDRDFSRMLDHKIVYKNKEQLTRFVTKRYEEYGPHGSANIVDQLEQLIDVTINPKYQLLVKAMRKAQGLYGCEPKLD